MPDITVFGANEKTVKGREKTDKGLQTGTVRVARLFTDFTTISYVVWTVPLQPMNCTKYKGAFVPVNE